MADLLGADFALVAKNGLYGCLDKILPHKQDLFSGLRQRWQDLFGARFDVLLYDLTSTYFESPPPDDEHDKRRYGYSRDKRSDCVQVTIALVVTPDGFPLAYEVLPGNTADATTLHSFLQKIEAQYGKAERIWVMDRGIPTEAVLAEMRQADPPVYYLVGTPKGRLTKLEQALLDKPWKTVRQGVDVKLLAQEQETYVFAQSHARIHKERAMRQRKAAMALHAPDANRRHDADAQGAADAPWRRTRQRARGMAAARYRYPRQRYRLHIQAQSQQAAQGAPARGTLSAAHQPQWPRSRRPMAVLYPTHRDRSCLQEPQG